MEDPNQPDLSATEKECCRVNFMFYDKNRQLYVELFELPMILNTCGYYLTDARIEELNQYIARRNI